MAKKVKTGGRKKGSINKATKAVREKVLATGLDPVEVMRDNMKFAHEEAAKIIARLLEDCGVPEGFNMLREVLSLREQSQECAKDLAPYVHPKLSTIEHNTGNKGFIVHVRTF